MSDDWTHTRNAVRIEPATGVTNATKRIVIEIEILATTPEREQQAMKQALRAADNAIFSALYDPPAECASPTS